MSDSSLHHHLSHQFPHLKFDYQLPLKNKAYFQIGGPAEVYIELENREAIIKVVSYCRQHQIKLTLLGGASNVIVADEGISGLVLRLKNNQVVDLGQTTNQGRHLIRAGAGTKTALLVRQSVDFGYQGLEYFLGVPGTVGGAVYNNAHYLSDLIGAHIHQVEVIGDQGQVYWLPHSDCQFAYDASRFHHTSEVILNVDLALKKGDRQLADQKIRQAQTYRATTQPLGLPSSGCIFQNVPNTTRLKKLFPRFAEQKLVPAGFIIDQAGLKGCRVGDIEVSDKHAAFMINSGQGTAHQLQELIAQVKAQVKDKFGVELVEEVFYLE